MKICFYSPYVPQHTGGGEKYFFDAARLAAEKHEVLVAISAPTDSINSDQIRTKYEHFLGVSLAKLTFISTPLGTKTKWWQKLWWTRQFELLYYVTDGSLFFSLAGKNILHIQIPFTNSKKSLVERLKLGNWRLKNTNSEFTRKVIEDSWQVKINEVHWPMIEAPVVVDKQLLAQKQPIIIHVGRFFRQLHAKRQDVLVEFFQKLHQQNPGLMKKWRLLLIGSVEDQAYFKEVQKLAVGLPVEILTSVSREALWHHYQQASIYWHATGFDVDEATHPEKVEHFGISTVEAMSSGCVPVVINKGGQREVLGESLKELLWSTERECLDATLEIIGEPALLLTYQQRAIQQAKQFDRLAFSSTLARMIEDA